MDRLEVIWVAAACAGSYSTVFFPDIGHQETAERARRVCLTLCSVTTVCADYAVEFNEPHGVWGGLTVKERRARRKSLGSMIAAVL